MRAIVLDDEPLALESMERMLSRQGVEVCGAFFDPLEAIRQAAKLAPDAAFVDIEMPGINGLAAAERLMAELPDLQVVFVSAYDQYAVNAFELNAVDYLLKPVQTKRLQGTLGRLALRMANRQASAPAKAGAATLHCLLRLGAAAADGREVDIPWRTSKAKEVFAYLLHMRNRRVSKNVLMDLIWPELDPVKAQTHLHTTVYQIRQTAKAHGLPIKLSFVDGGYRLELVDAGVDVDAWERRHALLMDTEAPSDEELEAWMEEYRGDYFELEGYLWAEQERERLRMKWLEGALRFAGRLGARTWCSTAHKLLTAMTARFPYVQEGYFQLMRMYHAQGQAQEVRRTFAALRETLLEETGEAPSDEIVEWFEAHY